MKAGLRVFSILLLAGLILGQVQLGAVRAIAPSQDEPPATPSPASPNVRIASSVGPDASYAAKNDISRPLRDIRPIRPRAKELRRIREIPRYALPNRYGTHADGSPPLGLDPALQETPGGANMPAAIRNFEGVNNVNGVLPPDTEGDVGPNHYVQWVNLSFAIWDKNGNMLYGPANGNTLWQGFGGICQSHNDGDPIVLYDHLEDRWLMSQMALGFPNNFHQCIAISQTPDPTGAWYRYDFLISTSKMNDYPKFGVWPDGYYMAINQFDGASFAWAGQGVVAFERDQMLVGAPAQMVYFDLFGTNPNWGAMLPSDLDGPPPPASSPNYFVEVDDDGRGWPFDMLQVFQFHVDWTNPGNSTFTGPQQINLTTAGYPFDSNMCNYARNCIPQPPPGEPVDAISDRLMYRLAYRNFGTHESLVVNHTVDVDTTDHAGLRWYEIRNPGGAPPTLHQAGTYAPDDDHRWMASIAMDNDGNMALGYSVSSNITFPSIRYVGRLAGDPLGTMPQGETQLIAGSGVQTHSSGRWGDYSMMTVDPTDDCTFWYTQEYYAIIGVAPWQTRVGSFMFPSCTPPATGILQGTVTDASTGNPVTNARVDADGYTTFTDASGFYQFPNLAVGTYNVTASAYGYASSTATGVVVASTTTQDFALTPLPKVSVSGTVTDASGHGWPLYARIDITAFGYVGTLFANPVNGTYSVELAQGVAHTFTVSAVSPGYSTATRAVTPPPGGSTEDFALTVDATCTAPGYSYVPIYFEDFEGGFGNWTMTGLWNPENEADTCGALVTPFPSSSNDAYYGIDSVCSYNNGVANTGDLTMVSPVTLPASGLAAVVFWSYEQTECGGDCTWDNRYVEISADGGGTWSTLGEGDTESIWYQKTFDLAPYAGNSVLVRFRFDTLDDVENDYFGWMVDNVSIATCAPTPGGLVVGNVYDAKTGKGLNGATVASDDQPADTTTTFATPDDPALDDGLYILFSSLTGGHDFTASRERYGSDRQAVTVAADDTVGQDFNLSAGYLSADPTSLTATVPAGQTRNRTLTLSNTGGLAASFNLLELRFAPSAAPQRVGPLAEPVLRVSPEHVNDPDARAVEDYEPSGAPDILWAGEVIQTWPTGLGIPWGIGFNTVDNDLWVSNPAGWGGDDLNYRFLTDGTNTGDTIDISTWVGFSAADMTYNPLTAKLWQVNVGGDNCIYELDPVAKVATGNKICPSFGTSERGLAFDPLTDTFYSGSWNDGVIYHFNSSGSILDSMFVGLDISGLAYNPSTGHLFVMTNPGTGFDVYVLDVNASYALLGGFNIAGLGNWEQAGLEMDCNGNLWAVNQSTQMVIEADSGETGVCDWRDIPWLSEAPPTGSIAASDDQVIIFTFDATGLADGTSQSAQVRVYNDTPYGAITIPVTLNVVEQYEVYVPLVMKNYSP